MKILQQIGKLFVQLYENALSGKKGSPLKDARTCRFDVPLSVT